MVYFEMALINGLHDRHEFNIHVNEELYIYLTCHDDAHSMGEDWFDITLTKIGAETIKKICKTDDEKKLIAPHVREGTIVDIIIHRTILVGSE